MESLVRRWKDKERGGGSESIVSVDFSPKKGNCAIPRRWHPAFVIVESLSRLPTQFS